MNEEALAHWGAVAPKTKKQKISLKDHISDMIQLLYKAIFRQQVKRRFDIQLEMYLKYEILFTLEYEI